MSNAIFERIAAINTMLAEAEEQQIAIVSVLLRVAGHAELHEVWDKRLEPQVPQRLFNLMAAVGDILARCYGVQEYEALRTGDDWPSDALMERMSHDANAAAISLHGAWMDAEGNKHEVTMTGVALSSASSATIFKLNNDDGLAALKS